MAMPNFLIIGAAKCGTTSLYHYLRQHPQIFMSAVKEPAFFAYREGNPVYGGPGAATLSKNIVTDIDSYQRLFDPAHNQSAIGEASPHYLTCGHAAAQIQTLIPDVKLVAMLRNPAERAFSTFQHLRRDGFEPESDFRAALKLEAERRQNNWNGFWYYREHGFYSRYLRPYFDRFGNEQIRVYLQEDMRSQPDALFHDLFAFLGVDTAFRPDSSTHFNSAGVAMFPRLHRLIAGPTAINRLARTVMPSSMRTAFRARTLDRLQRPVSMDDAIKQELMAGYRDEILQLETLLGRDLRHWRQ